VSPCEISNGTIQRDCRQASDDDWFRKSDRPPDNDKLGRDALHAAGYEDSHEMLSRQEREPIHLERCEVSQQRSRASVHQACPQQLPAGRRRRAR
jgi:hypothetical protein